MYRTAVGALGLAALLLMLVDLSARLWRRPPGGAARTAWWRMLTHAACFVCFAAIVTSGFSAVADPNGMTEDRLLTHVTLAPAFALAAVVVTLLWAHRNRFTRGDAGRLRRPSTWATPLRKFFFWMAALWTVPTLASILAAMLPFFGTGEQRQLVWLHRWCAAPLAACGLLFAYFALVAGRERSPD